MHQKNFVICDQEADYARNLMQMIGGRKELGFQMHMFQKLEPLKKFAEQKPIQILLIGEEYSQEERLEIPAAERFVLVKAEGRYLADEEKELYKYQSVDQILTKVLELSVDKERLWQRRSERQGEVCRCLFTHTQDREDEVCVGTGKRAGRKRTCSVSESGRVCRR